MTWPMREYPLTLAIVVRRILQQHPDRVVVDGAGRTTWGEVAERALRLMAVLRRLGVRPGDRVASFAGNSRRHLELSLAVPCLGAVLHPLNVRSAPDSVAAVVRTASDRLVFVDASLTTRFGKVRAGLAPHVRYVMFDDGEPDPDLVGGHSYEELLAGQAEPAELPELDERTAALLCHTSGTTGNPKGVLSSHRSQLLHTFGTCAADGMGVRKADTILSMVPMFHANGWGLPYAAALTGASLVMPGSGTDPRGIVDAVVAEQVTVAAAAPMIWDGVADHLDDIEAKGDVGHLSTLRAVVIGGAAPATRLIRRYAGRGVPVLYGWGMTETSSHASLTRVPADPTDLPERGATQGATVLGVEVRICGDDGGELPWDGTSVGELEVRGPWVASGYVGVSPAEQAAGFHDGWLRTGDAATIDRCGEIRVVDRIKDLVTSHGDWISSVELEELLTTHPAVREATVVAVPHPDWGERPVALVVTTGAAVTAGELRAHLASRVPHWWLPDGYVFCPAIPRSASGGYDKRLIRAYLRASRPAGESYGAPSARHRLGDPGRRRAGVPPPAQRTASDPVQAAPDGR
ncbi:MAG: long-chain-fatty-acid--CoA ligase [Micromonosporaceae bacterium]